MGVFIGWGTKFGFLGFLGFFGALTINWASFSVQTVEFVFKLSNLNSNGPIRRRRVTTALQ
jgi:hypothetical protein